MKLQYFGLTQTAQHNPRISVKFCHCNRLKSVCGFGDGSNISMAPYNGCLQWMHLFFSANPLVIKIFAHVHHVPNNYYRPQRSCEGYVFTRFCHSVHRGVCLSACWDTTPQEQTPRGEIPLEQTPPPRRLLLRTVRILLECILVIVQLH